PTAREHHPGSAPASVYPSHLKPTPERPGQARTAPPFTRRYWGMTLESDWRPGSPVIWRQDDVAIASPEQTVLEADPGRRLSYTWHTFTPEWAEANGIDEQTRATLA